MTDTKPTPTEAAMREARDIIRDLLAEHHCSAAERAYKEHETGADRIVGALVTAIDKLQPLDPIVDAALDKLIPWLDFGPHQSNEKCVAVRDAVVAAIRAMLLPPLQRG